MAAFVTGDNHYYHKNSMVFCPKYRPWDNIYDMNREMIAYHNSVVGENDVTYFVGDFVYGHIDGKRCDSSHAIAVIEQLNGYKHFVLGNHDLPVQNIPRAEYKRLGIMSVSSHIKFHSKEYGLVNFNHFPMLEFDGKRHSNGVLFHGHLHDKNPEISGFEVVLKHTLNVDWDMHGRYLTLEEAVEMAKKQTKDEFISTI